MIPPTSLIGYAFALSQLGVIRALPSEKSFPFSTEHYPSAERDSEPWETTYPSSAPSYPGQSCGIIAETVGTWSMSTNVTVPAELAYDCLTSVPVNPATTVETIDAIEKMVQFQSNLAYLKNPPNGYDNPPVDILGGLAEIRSKASRDEYANQYAFEAEIARLLESARDGHLVFYGPTFAGAVSWQREVESTLVSVSLDGGPPRVYALGDVNHTSTPSPVSRIDGEDVQVFLLKEADLLTYHDPDARWNNLFFRQAAQSRGAFVSPRWYPGPTTTVVFDNGTEIIYKNQAVLRNEESWLSVSDGDSFYTIFVEATPKSELRRRATSETAPEISKPLQQLHDSRDDIKRDIPRWFPEPYITGPSDVYINGYFMDHPNITNLAVLALQTFQTERDGDARQFQHLIERFLAEAKSRGSEKVIIDIQSNGGGRIFLGYDAFYQFFPDIEVFGGSRFRRHDAASVIGTVMSNLSSSEYGFLETSIFNFHRFMTSSGEPFTTWTDMYEGPSMNGDNFTQILRYNLSHPTLTSSSQYGEEFTVTGHGDRSNITTPPFAAEDIIILTDGVCGSTCTVFTEFMTLEAGVKVIVLGGRPQEGPMQFAGGTKGVNVLDSRFFNLIYESFMESSQRELTSILPGPFPIQAYEASVNSLDNIREGDESMTPTQFTNETANCRLWHTAETAMDIMELWTMVADVAWGGADGGIDESKCVPGSYRKESLRDDPPVPPMVAAESSTKRGSSDSGGDGVANAGTLSSAFNLIWAALPASLAAVVMV